MKTQITTTVPEIQVTKNLVTMKINFLTELPTADACPISFVSLVYMSSDGTRSNKNLYPGDASFEAVFNNAGILTYIANIVAAAFPDAEDTPIVPAIE